MKLLIPLFSPATGTWGGLTRVTALADAARQSDHKVAFCASGYLKTTLEQRGYQVYPVPESTFFGLPQPLSRLVEKRSQTAALPVKPGRDFGNIWFVMLLSGMARGGYLKRVVAAEMAAARDFGATTIFTDLDPGAFLLARLTGLPIAAAYQSPLAAGMDTLPWKLMNNAVNQVLHSHKSPACRVETLFHGPQVLKLIPSIPELEGLTADRPDVRYLGSLIGAIQPRTDFPLQADQRYVFVYLGTGSVSLNLAREILPGVFPSGGKLTCLVGAQSLNRVERGENVEFHPYLPADTILPFCDWTICHGGQNTIIQSLQHGVPLLVFPGPIFERRFNARKVQENGAGAMGELPDFTVAWLKAAFSQQEKYAGQANRLGKQMNAYGGAAAGIQALEAWATSHAPRPLST